MPTINTPDTSPAVTPRALPVARPIIPKRPDIIAAIPSPEEADTDHPLTSIANLPDKLVQQLPAAQKAASTDLYAEKSSRNIEENFRKTMYPNDESRLLSPEMQNLPPSERLAKYLESDATAQSAWQKLQIWKLQNVSEQNSGVRLVLTPSEQESMRDIEGMYHEEFERRRATHGPLGRALQFDLNGMAAMDFRRANRHAVIRIPGPRLTADEVDLYLKLVDKWAEDQVTELEAQGRLVFDNEQERNDTYEFFRTVGTGGGIYKIDKRKKKIINILQPNMNNNSSEDKKEDVL